MEGVHRISNEAYHTDPCPNPSLSRSIIRELIYRSPAHAYERHPRLNPNFKVDEDDKYDIGTAAHSLFLEGLDTAIIIDADDWRTKAAKEARGEARAKGKVPLLAKQYIEVEKMVLVAHKSLDNSELHLYIPDGDSELTYIWREGETWCRIRPDWINKERNLVLDYKTTGQSAHPEEYSRLVIAHGLDIQESFYKRGIEAIEGIKPDFIFMIQETEPPYLCSFVELDIILQEMGGEKVKYGLKLWDKCIASGQWDGYSGKIYTMEAPAWALASWETRKFITREAL